MAPKKTSENEEENELFKLKMFNLSAERIFQLNNEQGNEILI